MVDPSDLSFDFLELLSQAGWSPDRKVDIATWVTSLESEGFRSNPTALMILESVGGLSVPLPSNSHRIYQNLIRFDPISAATGEADRAEEWSIEIGVDLFPLGDVLPGYIIWAGSNAEMYYGHGFGLYYLGKTFSSAMDRLLYPTSEMKFCAE
ncbi:MAG: SUKH-3 domain-containing protein [Fimbriiglobus sp.]